MNPRFRPGTYARRVSTRERVFVMAYLPNKSPDEPYVVTAEPSRVPQVWVSETDLTPETP